jgi:hypothetical protein
MYSGVSTSGDVWHQVQRNDGNTTVYNLLLQPSGGNVGIGTTSPLTKLHVADTNRVFDSYGNINVFTTDTAAANIGGSIALGGTNTTSGTTPYVFGKIQGIKEGSASSWNGALLLGTTNTDSSVSEKMRITSAGNVGIGTTSPTTKLHVVNEAFIGNSGGTTGLILSGDNNSRIDFRSGSASTGQITCGNSSNLFIDAFDSRAIELALAGTTVFEVSNSANVGIGTAGSVNPSALLEVKSTTQGFLPPRMDEAERDAIGGPAIGLMVFNLGTDEVNVYTGAGWKRIQYI